MMTALPDINDPRVWRERAAKIRALAATVPSAETRKAMALIADQYERAAEGCEHRLIGSGSPSAGARAPDW